MNSPDGGRILAVDDSAVNRMVLTKALSADGHTALTAEHGLRALQLLHADGLPTPTSCSSTRSQSPRN